MKLPRVALTLACVLLAPAAAAATVGDKYMHNCAVCHLPGIAGAPKVGDSAEWSRRVRSGLNMLYRNAIQGMPNTAMMAKGGHGDDITDDEVKAIVDFMLSVSAIDAKTLEAARRYDKHGITDAAFARLDRNFDGYLTPNEVDATLSESFKRFDTNGDGRLSQTEYQNAERVLERERAAVTVPDATLVEAVRAALAKVQGVDLPTTKVDAEQGVVAMVGIVGHAEVARQAEDLVKRIKGVKKIDNRLISGHQMGWD